jgi:outer membrane protein assembly factor BamB
MTRPVYSFATFVAVTQFCITVAAQQADWPQWRGPDRTGLSKEAGLLKSWPEGGPRRVWMFEDCGTGFGGPAIVDGRIYIMGARGTVDYLFCLDAAKGTEIWKTSMGPAFKSDWGDGSRGTPTVSEGHVYAFSGAGTLICVRAGDGREVWRSWMEDVGGEAPFWGYSESALVDGDRVLCTPGGKDGAVIAFNKRTGKVLWQSKDVPDVAHYASMIRHVINGQPQYVHVMEKRIIGLAPDTGKLMWESPFPGRTAVIPTPVAQGNRIFATAGYGIGCVGVEIQPRNTPRERFQNTLMKNHHGGVILVGNYVYGHSDPNGWMCMEFATGKQVWVERQKLGKGAIAYADGMLYLLSEGDGEADTEVALIEANPAGWKEHSRFTLSPQTKVRKPQGRIWTHPVVAGGKLYLRDQDLLFCFDVKAR